MQTHNYTEEEVLKLWNDAAGKVDEFVLQKGKYLDNLAGGIKRDFVALVHKFNGSIVAQVNGQNEQDTLNMLAVNAGKTFVQGGVVPANQVDISLQPGTVENQPSSQLGYAHADTVETSNATPASETPPSPGPNAQEALAGKTVDVSDVTPEEGQSTEQAVEQATGAGTPVSSQNAEVPVGTGQPAPTGGAEASASENPGEEAGNVSGDTVGA